MKKAWRYRYAWQYAGYLVFCGDIRLRDVFPDIESAREEARILSRRAA